MNNTWDPDKSNRLLDACQEILQAIRDGTLDSDNLYPKSLAKLGDKHLNLVKNAFYRSNRPQWVQKYFPKGWPDFLNFLKELDGNGTIFNGSHQRHNVLTNQEHEDIEYIQMLYDRGVFDYAKDKGKDPRQEAVRASELFDIVLTPGQELSFFRKRNGNGQHQEEPVNHSLEQRIRQVKKRHTDPKSKIKKIKATNPLLRLGEAYQNLVLAALGLAHIDGRVIPEVTLTYEKKDGKLTRTTNIADAVVIGDGPRKIYEIKLGRQRARLKKQVLKQLAAAKKRHPNAESRIVAGTKRDAHLLGHTDHVKLDREIEERVYELQSIDELFADQKDVSILSLDELLTKGFENLKEKLSHVKQTKLPGCEFPDWNKLVGDLTWMAMGGSYMTINVALQSRRMSLEDIERYDDNLYLLQKYINGPFRKKVKPGKLKKSFRLNASPLDELSNIFLKLNATINHYPEIVDEILKNPRVSKINQGVNKVKKQLNKVLRLFGREFPIKTYEEKLQDMFGKDTVEFWADYFGNEGKVKRILQERTRLGVHYEEDGYFKPGRRVITKRKDKEYQWLIDSLEAIGVDTSDIDFKDKQELEEHIKIIEDYDAASQEILERSLQEQKRVLKRRKSDLEILADDQKFSRKTGSQLTRYERILRKFGIEGELGLEPLEKRNSRDGVISFFSGFIDFYRKIRNKLDKNYFYFPILSVKSSLKGEQESFATVTTPIVRQSGMPTKMFQTLMASKKERDRRERIEEGFRDIYNGFNKEEITKGELNKLQNKTRKYIKDILEKGDDLKTYEHNLPRSIFERGDSLHYAIVRNHLFKETDILEKYLAARILQSTSIAKEIYDFDPEKAKEYLELARKEIKEGKDYGSIQKAKETIVEIYRLATDREKLEQRYLNRLTVSTNKRKTQEEAEEAAQAA